MSLRGTSLFGRRRKRDAWSHEGQDQTHTALSAAFGRATGRVGYDLLMAKVS